MIISRYVNAKQSTKITVGSLLVLIAFALSLNAGTPLTQLWIAPALVALLGVVLHFCLTYLRSALTLAVVAFQGFIVWSLSESLGEGIVLIEKLTYADQNLLNILLASSYVTTTLTFLYLAYKYTRGRVWLNTALAYFLFNIVATPIWANNSERIPLALLAGYAAGIIYLLVRSIQRRPAVTKAPLSKNLQDRTESIMNDSGLVEATSLIQDNRWLAAHYLALDGDTLYVVHSPNVRAHFSLTSAGMEVDSKDRSDMLAQLFLDIDANRKDHPAKYYVPVVLLPNKAFFPQGLTTVSISKRKQPDNKLGNVAVADPASFVRLVKKNRALTK